MEFQREGQSMKCNLCGWVSQLPESFVRPIDKGRRLDYLQLPELSLGSYDIKAG
jgi:hypothetical protein